MVVDLSFEYKDGSIMPKYKRYDILSKVAFVEEYLERVKTNPKLSISDYAFEKDLADSTFNDWLLKYKKDKNRFIYGVSDGSVDLSPPSIAPTFIEISKDRIAEPTIINNPSSTIKLNYKDVSLEFGINELERVLEIIRRW